MKKENLLLATIVLLAAILRFWQLGIIPAGVTHDELGYIYNAYSIAKTGRNIFGEFLPFLTWIHEGGWPYLPIPIYISAPFFWIFDLSATTGRLPSAILGVIDVLLIYILVKQIFKKTSLALLSALFLSISPWHLHFSRSAYDTNFSLFFYLFAVVVFIHQIKKKRLPLISLAALLLAVFSYRGMNIIFLPIVLTLSWYGITILKMSKRQLTGFVMGILLIIGLLTTTIVLNGKGYAAEVLTFNDPRVQEEIDTQIREAQGPLFIRRIFLNKPLYMINKLRENYVKAYSPEFLFLYTEPSKIYSIWSRGRIYFLDLILIILGVAYLYKINKKGASFIIAMVLIGGLPGMLSGMPYSARNFFLSAFFPILSAGGALFLLNNPWLKKLKVVTVIILILSYSYIFSGYLFDYYGRYALYGAEAWVKSLREVSFIILKQKEEYDKVIVGTASFVDLMQYGLYVKVSPWDVQKSWISRENSPQGQSFLINNVLFIPTCLDDEEYASLHAGPKQILYFVHENCHRLSTPSAYIKDYKGNTIWKIYELNKK